MILVDYYIKGLTNYINFEGRTTRAEFWYYTLAVVILTIILEIFELTVGLKKADDAYSLLGLLFSLAHILPGFAISARRFHDIGKSGWYNLIVLIPVLGIIAFIYFMVQPSDEHENQFGPAH